MAFEDLPEVSPSHSQSDESERALASIFFRPQFILRRESPDYGVDYTCELCVDGRASNFRFHIQLKSSEDGPYVEEKRFITVEIKTSRLNYLSRGHGKSILVLYDARTKRLFFDWILSIFQRLDASNPSWRTQETVTVRLPVNSELTAQKAGEIHSDVLSYNRQQFNQTYSPLGVSASVSEGAKAALKVPDDPAAVISLIENNGLSLISDGLHREVLSALDVIPKVTWMDNLKVLLAATFAYANAGLPLQALYHANRLESGLKGKELSESEQALLLRVQITAKLSLGQISVQDHYDSLGDLGKRYPNTLVGIHAAIDHIIFKIVYAGQDVDPLEQVLALAQQASSEYDRAKKVLGLSGTEESILEVSVARAEFEAADQALMNGILKTRMSEQMGYPFSSADRLALMKQGVDLRTSALKRVERIRSVAKKRGAVHVEAYALLTSAEALYKSHRLLTFVAQGKPIFPNKQDEDEYLEKCIIFADYAREFFEQLEFRQMVFRAVRVKSDVLKLQGKHSERDGLMEYLKREALFLGYPPESTELAPKEMPAPQDDSTDARQGKASFWVELSESDVRKYAKTMLDTMKLPQERLPYVENDIRASMVISEQKLKFCKHLELEQDLKHTLRRATAYTQDPNRGCKCLKLGHRSIVETPDPETVIRAFKSAYCQGCDDREL